MAKRKGWIIFFVIVGLFMLLGVMFIFGIRAALEDKPIVKEDTVLRIDFAGLITEQYSRDAFGRELEGANLQMHDLRQGLEMAKADDRIRGIFLYVSGLDIGWAKAQEIRTELQKFKESGKFVTAYIFICDEIGYYLALAADEIYIQPQTFVELNGFASEVPFLKNMFNKLGMEPQVDNIGKYKSAGDILKRESMSPEHREATEALLADIYEEFVQSVSSARGIDRSELAKALENGVYQSETMRDLQLVDDLKYQTEVEDLLKQKIYGEEKTDSKELDLTVMNIRRYAKLPPEEVGLGKGSKIALIYAIGGIESGRGGHDPFFGRTMGSGEITRMLQDAEQDESVKAVIMRVDSPGGSGIASDEIWAEIEEVQEKKPVIISMSDVAASGGYWISMGADAIVAQPLTITGSIGVVSAFFNLSGTYDKLGIDWETVKTNEHADLGTDKRAMTEEEWQTLQKLNRDFYQFFVKKVADGRNMSYDRAEEVAQGRVWMGTRALEHGLVDSLGGLDAALAIAKDKADISVDAKTQWQVYPKPRGLFESLVERFNVAAAKFITGKNSDFVAWQNLPGEAKALLRQLSVMSRARNGEPMAFAPYLPEVK